MKLFPPTFKMNFPEIVDIALPAEGVFHNHNFMRMPKLSFLPHPGPAGTLQVIQ